MRIQSTKYYDQFKLIPGNRPINQHHVNELNKLVLENDLSWQFPALISKDGYILDGQHRWKRAKDNDALYFYTVSNETLDQIGDSMVPVSNTAQKRWIPENFIHWYAVHGRKQYQYLESLIEEHKLKSVVILSLLGFAHYIKPLKKGNLNLGYDTDAKKIHEEIIEAYLSLKPLVPQRVFIDSVFTRSVRDMFKKVSAEDIRAAIERAPMKIVPMREKKDYLRQFEDIFNYGRSEHKYVRFF